MDKDKMLVITDSTVTTRGSGPKQLKVDELAINITVFLEQMETILSKAPDKIGKFHFDELEVHAEITAQGTIALLGTGVQAGASGGIRFVFRRETANAEKNP